MTVLFDAHHLGRRQTGNEVWIRNVVRAMQPLVAADEVEYVVTEAGAEELRGLTDSRIHVVSGSSVRRLAAELPSIARTRRSDAVFVTYTAPLSKTPAVVLVHDMSPWLPDASDWLSLPTRLRYRVIVSRSCRLAQHLLVPSHAARSDLVDLLHMDAAKVSVAPNALDFEMKNLLAAAPAPQRVHTALRVLTVGNVLPRKNLVMLAEAVRACRSWGLGAELRVVGSVSRAGTRIHQQMRECLGSSVHFTGYVTQQRLADEYRSADVLAFPSLLEGFGIPVLEAMAAGVPVVVSNAGSLPETAGGAALVREPHDVSGWRDALQRLATDSQLRGRLIAGGFQRVDQFSWGATARVVVDALRATASRSARSG